MHSIYGPRALQFHYVSACLARLFCVVNKTRPHFESFHSTSNQPGGCLMISFCLFFILSLSESAWFSSFNRQPIPLKVLCCKINDLF